MVMPQDASEEAQVAPQDELDIEQAALETAVEEVPAMQYATMEQYNSLMGENASLRRHLAGLESRIDRGLNGLNQNLETLTAEAARQEVERQQAALLASIEDPDERARWKMMLDIQNARNPQPSAPPAQQQYQEPVQEQTASEAQAWAQVQQFVRNAGVDPSNPAINYAALTDGSLTQEQRQSAFMQSLIGAARNGQQPASPQPQQQPQQRQQDQTTTPQRPAGPAAAGGFKNVMDVYDAYAKDRNMTREDFERELAKFGETP